MRILLIEPPQGDPAQPYSSLSVLLGAWRSAGIDVDVRDLNMEFFNYLCRTDTIQRHLYQVRERLSSKTFHNEDEKRLLQRADTSGDCILSGIQKALGILKDKSHFYNPSLYAWAIRLISRSLETVSAGYYPGKVSLQTFQTAHSHLSSHGILASIADEKSNPFVHYCDEVIKEQFIKLKPDIMAVSVTFQTQLIPAYTLAAKVKTWLPGIKVVFGGGAITRINHKLLNSPHLFRDVDACIIFEGETAFPALLHEWEKGRSGLAAPTVMVRTTKTKGISMSEKIHIEDMDILPSPDHRGLSLHDYWWPEPALLINCARGCYWGRCAFCQISQATRGPQRNRYRLRSAGKIASDVVFVNKQTGALSFNLSVDALPPRALVEISDALKAAGLPVSWDTEIRLDKGLNYEVLKGMADSGCRYIRFGFESASDRVTKLMNKGTSLKVTDRILNDCRDIGITVSLMCQIGFPGETPEESRQTISYLKKVHDRVAFISIVPFVLEHGSIIFQNPDRYGIQIYANPEHEDLSWMYNYTSTDGIESSDTYALYEELERLLDKTFPDRDLFFKGGLGHAHTSLYTRQYPFKTFITWNQHPHRGPDVIRADSTLRTAKGLSLKSDSDSHPDEKWSKFIVSSTEVPEKVITIHGSALLVLAACVKPVGLQSMAHWIRHLSNYEYSADEADALIESLYEAGLLLTHENDRREVPFMG